MGFVGFSDLVIMVNFWVFLFGFLSIISSSAFANVVLIANNVTLSFDDIEANFCEFFNLI